MSWNLLEGWQIHPLNGSYAYHVVTREVRPLDRAIEKGTEPWGQQCEELALAAAYSCPDDDEEECDEGEGPDANGDEDWWRDGEEGGEEDLDDDDPCDDDSWDEGEEGDSVGGPEGTAHSVGEAPSAADAGNKPSSLQEVTDDNTRQRRNRSESRDVYIPLHILSKVRAEAALLCGRLSLFWSMNPTAPAVYATRKKIGAPIAYSDDSVSHWGGELERCGFITCGHRGRQLYWTPTKGSWSKDMAIVRVPEAIAIRADLTAGARCLWALIAYHQERDRSPSVAQLAAAMGVNRSTIKRRCQELEAARLLQRSPGIRAGYILAKVPNGGND